MASILDTLGISTEIVEAVEPVKVSEGYLWESGLYDVTVDKAYIRKTDSGANMFELDLIGEKGKKFHYATAILSGDQKGNKSTYTNKNGKEVPLPGVSSMVQFLIAIGKDPKQTEAQEGQVVHRDQKITALCFNGLQGLKLKVGIFQYESEYQGEVSVRNDIKYFLSSEGKNAEGNDLTEKAKKNLADFPLRKLKTQPQTATVASVGGSESAPGW